MSIQRLAQNAWVPAISVLIALVLAGVIIFITGSNPLEAYRALAEGAFLRPATENRAWAFTDTLVASTPFLLLALGISLSFTAGLFNIGAEGQFYMGALLATILGFKITGLPALIHLPVVLMGGAVAGALWGSIAGVLKAKRGASEVITTIMLNYVAYSLVDYLVNGPIRGAGSAPRTPDVEASAAIPTIFAAPDRLHYGFILAIVVAVAYWFVMQKTPLGFRIRTVGQNADAARYAGMSVDNTTITAMALSGAICGLAGAVEVLSLYRYLPSAFTSGYGFDSIAVSLLGQGHPIGIALAALLFGALQNGSTYMQFSAGVSNYIIAVLQAFIIIFVAAPDIIRGVFKRRAVSRERGA
jgi:general nucleoside transport system permease protein